MRCSLLEKGLLLLVRLMHRPQASIAPGWSPALKQSSPADLQRVRERRVGTGEWEQEIGKEEKRG